MLSIACVVLSALGSAFSFGAPISIITSTFFETHCADCHDEENHKGNLTLTTLQAAFGQPENHRLWVKIHDALEKGEMPPKKCTPPSAEERSAAITWIRTQLTEADRQRIERDGRTRLRRMTRSEYENTLKDLLALPRLEVQALLPLDGAVAGFRKNAQGLDLSPAHLAAYAAAAEKALELATATRSTPPPIFKSRLYPAGLFKFRGNLADGNFLLLKNYKPDPQLPLRGGFEHIDGYIPDASANNDMENRKRLYEQNQIAKSESAVGLLSPNFAGHEAALNVAPIHSGFYRMKLSIWGFLLNAGNVISCESQAAVLRAHEEGKQQEGGRLLSSFTAPALASTTHNFTAWLDAHESIVFDPVSIPSKGLRIGQRGGRTAKHIGPGVALDWFEIEGPLFESWPPESHRRLFGSLPIQSLPPDTTVIPPSREKPRQIPGYLPAFQSLSSQADRNPPLETVISEKPDRDASQLLLAFITRAFRRPVSNSEVQPYLALFQKRMAARECFEDALRRAYVAVLTSPEFLFHSADPVRNEPHSNPNDFILASRLSYWLWNGPPDESLLKAAQDNSLHRTSTLQSQVDRMISDPRFERFLADFTDQWLELHRVEETTPDKKLYPEYTSLLHEGMVAETRAFVRELILYDLPVTHLAKSNFAMLTQRLAEHYGIEGVNGTEVRRVELPSNTPRGGLLGQAAILKLTANGTTTSPVKRGVWVMDRLLNDPAPPPPKGVSQIDPDTRGATTIREQLDRHRSDSNCSTCHAKIDPAGFAMECFDPIGGLRSRYRSTGKGDLPPERTRVFWNVGYRLGPAVDPSGQLPDGRSFTGVEDLQSLLAREPERLAVAFLTHLSRYATSVEPSFADRETLLHIARTTAPRRFGMRSLLHALAQSPLFIGSNPSAP